MCRYSEGSAKYAKNPLLTKKQEYFLGTIVQRAVPLMKLRNSFLEETGTMPTVETIAKLAERDLGLSLCRHISPPLNSEWQTRSESFWTREKRQKN